MAATSKQHSVELGLIIGTALHPEPCTRHALWQQSLMHVQSTLTYMVWCL
jgi:hypothetical protein